MKYMEKDVGRLLKDYNEEGVKHIINEELLTCNTDILIPAAMENQINEKINCVVLG